MTIATTSPRLAALLPALALLLATAGGAPARAEEAPMVPPSQRFFPPAEEPPRPPQVVLVGVGPSFAFADTSAQASSGTGVQAEATWVRWPDGWFSPRLGAGLAFSGGGRSCDDGLSPCEVLARYLHATARARLMAPIPWVAPYFEVGLGVAVGQHTARVGQVVDRSGIGAGLAVPFALGLAVGPRHEVEVGIQYLSLPTWRLVGGGFLLGFGLRI